MRNHCLALLGICCLSLSGLEGQTRYAYLTGQVADRQSNEPLVGATVYLPQTGKGAITDALGRYSLALPLADTVQLQVSYVGYQRIDTSVFLRKKTAQDFRLSILTLGAVEVKSKIGQLQHDVLQIPVERLKAIPMLFGQPDLIKALAFLPGVSTGVEGTTGLFVRGGTPDQNLILLDGATVYNSSHLFGFQSVFDPSAIKDIRLIKGGFPAKYGGRLSSIVDITLKEGDNQAVQREFTLGLINSGLRLEGPIAKGKSSYLVSGRAAYLGLLLLPTAVGWKRQDDQPFNTMLSYDFNLKANHEFRDRSKLLVSAYLGRDLYLTKFRFDSSYYQTNLGWGNETATLRYVRPLQDRVFLQSQLTYNRYSSSENNQRELLATGQQGNFLRASTIQDWAFKQLFALNATAALQFSGGLELLKQSFCPSSLTLTAIDQNLDSLAELSQRYQAFSYAVFGEGEWKLWQWLELRSGLRYSVYQVETQTRPYWEPRLNLRVHTGRFSGSFSYTHTTQFVHLLANNSLGLFSDLWVPSTDQVAPQLARQYSGGIIFRSPSAGWEFSLEAYQKYLRNQIDYRQGIDFFAVNNLNWENTIEKNGIGRAQGIELMIKRETERSNAWLAYTLSNNERQFAAVNNGAWYPFRYDRRHNLAISLVKRWRNNWTFGWNFVVQSGTWVTLPVAQYPGAVYSNVSLVNLVNRPREVPETGYFLSGRNNQRLPAFHRMDCSFSKNYTAKKGRGSSALSASIYNLYARKNPFVLIISGSTLVVNGQVNNFRTVRSKALFTFVPSLAYTKKW